MHIEIISGRYKSSIMQKTQSEGFLHTDGAIMLT